MSAAKQKSHPPDVGERRDSETRTVAASPKVADEDALMAKLSSGWATDVDGLRKAGQQEVERAMVKVQAALSQNYTGTHVSDPELRSLAGSLRRAWANLDCIKGELAGKVAEERKRLDVRGPPDERERIMLRDYDRWSAAAMAAVLALPAGFCSSADEWISLLDELDAAISSVIRQKQAQ